MSESPYQPQTDSLERRFNEQLRVFGAARMAELEAGNGSSIASDEATQLLLNVIDVFAAIKGDKSRSSRKSFVIQPGNPVYVPVQYNPEGIERSNDEPLLSRAIAVVFDMKRDMEILKPAGLALGNYAVKETLFIDELGVPKIRKQIEGMSGSLEAVKLATEAEVDEARGIIVNAFIKNYHDDLFDNMPKLVPEYRRS